jgi:hypothetical protein
VINNKIVVIGGTTTNLTQIYDPETDTWGFGASIPVKVSGAGVATVTYPDETTAVCVVGGEADVFSPLNVTQIYFPKNNSWKTGASLPNVNSRLSASYIDNNLYVIGGTRAVIHHGLAENLQCNIFNVIPEFQSWTILPLFLILVALVAIQKKRLIKTITHKTKQNHTENWSTFAHHVMIHFGQFFLIKILFNYSKLFLVR